MTVAKAVLEAIWGTRWGRLIMGDLLVTGALAGLAAILLWPATHSSGAAGSIELRGTQGWSASWSLGRDGVIHVPGPLGTTTVEVRSGRARIISSPCPRQLCRQGGTLGAGAGRILVCAPNGVVVRLVAGVSDRVDALTR